MCGITGIFAFTDAGAMLLPRIEHATACLKNRGPDASGIFRDGPIALGHTRLAIIDTSEGGSQPMTDPSGRYTIVFNGEFFNYREHRNALSSKGVQFSTQSDTEVLLQLYIAEGAACLEKVNGFFAFAIYDKQEQSLFIARDRMGLKPLVLYRDEDKLMFASELKSLVAMGIPRKLDFVSIYTYLQLNYIPGPSSIFENVRKVQPGHFLKVSNGKTEEKQYYTIPFTGNYTDTSYEASQEQCISLLDKAVERRLIADVPLGAFLSGGIDSSLIVALAARKTRHLKTFSIGYKNEPRFDETYYAALVSRKYNTDHTVFSLTNQDLYANLHAVLDYTDEPFADSSALAVHILSMHTRKHVTVALSGDGADELFGGYNKHRAEHLVRASLIRKNLVRYTSPLWGVIPQSRGNRISNGIRQLNRFAEGIRMSPEERYWRWCSFQNETQAASLLAKSFSRKEYERRKESILHSIKGKDLNDVLYTDMQLVLPNDMLAKVDMMSMANGLEVRCPFLDYEMVNFAFGVPPQYKVNKLSQKRILRDAGRKLLPEELYSRRKQGFEVPLLKWFRSELKSMILDELLNEDLIEAQGIFDPEGIRALKTRLFSENPGDIHAQIWALVVFQYWWKKWMS